MPSADAPQPQLAASVLLIRPDAQGQPEIFFVRRHGDNPFMADHAVFVGGGVDPGDRHSALQAQTYGVSAAEAAARLGYGEPTTALAIYIAAVRETLEESGVLISCSADGAALSTVLARKIAIDVQHGHALTETIQTCEAYLALDRLRYLSRWVTPEIIDRRYDTFFFVCELPAGQAATHDGYEATESFWLSPRAALEAGSRGQLLLSPPTSCILEDLLQANSCDELLGLATDRPAATMLPQIDATCDPPRFVLPGDYRYDPKPAEPDLEHFFALRDGVWRRFRRSRAT